MPRAVGWRYSRQIGQNSISLYHTVFGLDFLRCVDLGVLPSVRVFSPYDEINETDDFTAPLYTFSGVAGPN